MMAKVLLRCLCGALRLYCTRAKIRTGGVQEAEKKPKTVVLVF